MSTIETSPDIKDIAAALLILQGKVEGVRKNGKNPAFKTKYATLESVIDTVRPVLQEAGIVFLQAPGMVVEGKLSLTTRLMHPSSGQWIQSTVQAPLSKQDAQAVGSATTYLCRYSLMAILGVPPVEDDDAQSATSGSTSNRAMPLAPPREDTRTASQRMRDDMIADLEKREGAEAIDRYLNHPTIKRDRGLMDGEDLAAVDRFAAARREAKPVRAVA